MTYENILVSAVNHNFPIIYGYMLILLFRFGVADSYMQHIRYYSYNVGACKHTGYLTTCTLSHESVRTIFVLRFQSNTPISLIPISSCFVGLF